MKKKIFIILLLSILLIGCSTDIENTEIIEKKEYCNPSLDDWGTFEWVSPDGVHYWVYIKNQRYGIAPRYDSNGDLVIDQKGN